MIKRTDYIIITGWMNNLITERFKDYLNSSEGFEDEFVDDVLNPCKIIYSIIFNLCSIDNSHYDNIEYLMDWTQDTKQEVINNLNWLVKIGLLEKCSEYSYKLVEVD